METLDLPIKEKPFKLTEDFIYWSDYLVAYVIVPAGYRTDFASVPRFFWRIFPPMGRYAKAAVVHDYLCDVQPKEYNSKQAAKVFDEAMRLSSVPGWKRRAMYNAVRFFGPRFKADAR